MDKDKILEGVEIIKEEIIDEEEAEEIKEEEVPSIRGSLTYVLLDESGEEIETGQAEGEIYKESISIIPKFGILLSVPFRDMLDVIKGNYRLCISLSSREKIVISDLGYKFEDFMATLCKLRNELILKDMLMEERLIKSDIEAEFIRFSECREKVQGGSCELRLYETGIVIIPELGYPIRIPYSVVSEVHEKDYGIILKLEIGEEMSFSMMGRQFEPFKKSLAERINSLSIQSQSQLKDFLPAYSQSVIRRAARLLKDGRAASKRELDYISPDLWRDMEKKLEVSGVKEEYDFLKSIGREDRACIGIKRGLLGNLTGEYIWFLVPIYSIDNSEIGNAVAMEAPSLEGGGKATYFFRITDREEYKTLNDLEGLHIMADRFVKTLNYCMLSINFRREPIYISDENLLKPDYISYRTAVERIPELKFLRECFIGRVIHSSYQQWRQDVIDLLRFNISSIQNDLKWNKKRK